MTDDFHDIRRVVIKIGSSLVVDVESRKTRRTWMMALADDIRAMMARGMEVVLVSSGAVAMGRSHFDRGFEHLKLEEKQALAAYGQLRLMESWQMAFDDQHVAQLLLTLEDTEDRRRYLNARNTLDTLIDMGVVPIINENDTVATRGIRFGDNDRLAARVAQMAGADALVLLSDIDGLYTADPRQDADAEHIPVVKDITPEIEAMAGEANTIVSNGGMFTKIEAAKIALSSGCHMVITRGKDEHVLKKLWDNEIRSTWFYAKETPDSARKHWIAGTLHPTGTLYLDKGAANAILKDKSLLPAGVIKIEGDFSRGDAVWICAENGDKLAKGLVAYKSEDARKIMGCHSDDVEKILGYDGRTALVHRDDLVIWTVTN